MKTSYVNLSSNKGLSINYVNTFGGLCRPLPPLLEEAEVYDVKKIIISDRGCSALPGMENYTKMGKLGEGTYGVVFKVGEVECCAMC